MKGKGKERMVTVSERVGRGPRWKWVATLLILLVLGSYIFMYAALKSLDFNNLKPTLVTMIKETTGQDLAVGRICLRVGLTPMLLIEDLALRNPNWTRGSDLVQIRRLEIHVELLALLHQKVVAKRLVLIDPDVKLEASKSGVSNLDFKLSGRREESETPPLKPARFPRVSFHEIVVKNGRFSLKRADSTEPTTFVFESVEIKAKGSDFPIQLRARGFCKGRAFALQALTGSLEQLLSQQDPWPLEASIEALEIHSNIRGSIPPLTGLKGVTFSVAAEGQTTRNIKALLNLEHLPEMGSFNLTAKISCPEVGTYNISDLRLNIERTQVSSSFEVHVGGKKPKIIGFVHSRNLDLRPFLDKRESGRETQQGKRVFSGELMKIDCLAALDGELKLHAKRTITPYGLIQNLQLDALLKDSRFTVRSLKASIGGGAVELRGVCRPVGNNVAVSGALKLENLGLSRLLRDLRTEDSADGTVGGELEFSSFGHSLESLIAHLNARTVLTVEKGTIQHCFVRLLGGELSTSLLELLGVSKSGEYYTDVGCAVCGLDIRGGLAKITALVVDTPEVTVYGSGEVDLGTERLDLSLEPSSKRGFAGLSLSIGELAKPFKLTGSLAAPSLAVDPGKTALTIGKAIAGVVLFGPLGIAGALAGRSSDHNPCEAALEAARKTNNATPVEKAEEPTKFGNLLKPERFGGH